MPETNNSESPKINPPETWLDLYGEYLYRYAMSRLRDPEQASDCLQDTMLAGIKNLKSFDGRIDVKFWLRGIMRNKIIDRFRKAKREAQVDLGDDEGVLETAIFKYSGIGSLFPEEWKFDPRKNFDRGEFWEVFNGCVDELKDPVRQAFVLRMLEDMETEEVCKVMQIEANYLWVLLHRARKQLRGLMNERWNNPQ